jgi:hypothetical protein
MSYPTDPKSITVRDQIVSVLRDIVAGEDFFFTPAVFDNWKHWKEIESFPSYEVYFGDGQELVPNQGLQYEETFTLIVHGRVKTDDPSGDIRKCLRDVRKAIMTDAASGTLGTLTLLVKPGASRTDHGQEAGIGSGWFEQDFQVTINGNLENL